MTDNLEANPLNAQLGIRRYLFILLVASLLSMSFFMSVLAPFPMTVLITTFGRYKGHIGLVAVGILLLLYGFSSGAVYLVSLFVFSYFISIIISESILREVSPVKSLVSGSLIIFTLLGSLSFIAISQNEKSLKETIVEEIKKNESVLLKQLEAQQNADGNSQDTFEFAALVRQPELLADMILKKAFGYLYAFLTFTLWFNLFLSTKSYRVYLTRIGLKYPLSELSLLNFKVPDVVIWPLILCLAGALFGEQISISLGIVCENLMWFFGVFYFFQGFGIYLAFLDKLKIRGLLRTLLVVITLFTANYALAVVGVLDMFVDFRKLMFKKSNKGE